MKLLVPPPLVFIAAAALAWGLGRLFPGTIWRVAGQGVVSWVFCALAIGLGGWAVLSFMQRRTTVSPHHPDRSKTLVTDGPYRVSRNPMYLALALAVAGFLISRGLILGVVPLMAAIAYITLFQIRPEEAALRRIFGDAYVDYCNQVRRWV